MVACRKRERWKRPVVNYGFINEIDCCDDKLSGEKCVKTMQMTN
jgi:hypothetical protein